MKKKIGIITYSHKSGIHYKELLDNVFENEFEIVTFSFEKNDFSKIDKVDLVLASNDSIYEATRYFVPEESNVIIIDLTISKNSYKKLMAISKGTDAMLVNLSLNMAVETIGLLYQLGIYHLRFYPAYPNMDSVPDLDIAVTPGEKLLVPKGVKKVIDIGNRLFSMGTIINIAVKAGIESLLSLSNVREYFDNIVVKDSALKRFLTKADILENQVDVLLKTLNKGFIGINRKGIITEYNDIAESILGIKKAHVMGRRIKNVASEFPFEQVYKTGKILGDIIVRYKGQNISTLIFPVHDLSNNITGAYATFNLFNELEKNQHKLRAQLVNKGHRAKYTLDDIVGESDNTKNLKQVAQKMAQSDSSILISGESGTGKELYAHAIHNLSNRRPYQLVAINCAALPESLLESELFGYEEGAFTGALKGGKIGFFELAHLGTLFLDEISEMPLSLQTRLLRVIQEREVIRIGSDKVIDVDVRIIAATNRELKKLVNQGKFRRDLYYRLNVLPLNIAPLRDRKQDIHAIMDFYYCKLNSSYEITDSAKAALVNHEWEGNVRELRNCMEYLDYLSKNLVDVEDLPSDILPSLKTTGIKPSTPVEREPYDIHITHPYFAFEKNPKLDKYRYILTVLYEAYLNRERIGRRKILTLADNEGHFFSEQEIRTLLMEMQVHGWVEISRGRRGTTITNQGIDYLKKVASSETCTSR